MSDADKPDNSKRNQPPQIPARPTGVARPGSMGRPSVAQVPARPNQPLRPGMSAAKPASGLFPPGAKPMPQATKAAPAAAQQSEEKTAANPLGTSGAASGATETAASLGFGAQRLGNPNAVPRPGMAGGKKAVSNKPVDDARLQANGFTAEESVLLREALQLAGLRYFDGDGLVMGKKENTELSFKAGQSQNFRWIVMGFPMYNMNMPNAVEICLHFMAESYDMVHMLDFQYQVGINMETENLEFLIQLPLLDITAAQLSELINVFFQTLNDSVMKEMDNILQMMREDSEDE